MTTQAEYDAATAAVLKTIQADIIAKVPEFERGMIPASIEPPFAAECARAAVDAAAKARGA